MIAVAVMIMALAVPAVSSAPVCHACNKQITEGRYIEVGARYFHDAHFRCARCSKHIGTGRFWEEDGIYYDSACWATAIAPKCAHCKEAITAEYTVSENRNYHKSCYYAYIALRCSLCGETIQGKYLIDYWGNTVHETHKDMAPQCEYCRRFISDDLTGGGITYKDERTICGLCASTAIHDLDIADDLLIDLARQLQSLGIDVKDDTDLKLVGKQELMRQSGDFLIDPSGVTLYERSGIFGGLIKFHDVEIYALYGMPRLHLIKTLAHELMHTWIFRNCPLEIDRALSEGSCNYAAFLILQTIDDEEAAFEIKSLMEDTNPYYGVGFRKVMEFAEREGTAAWLEYLRHNKRPPW
jgi:hypothetical protein